jgi:hypothetical protein
MITDSDQWNDYSETDCVLAIRDFENKWHYNKPFSKIINGYLAGVPVIAGNESSAIYLKKVSDIDIPIVKNSEECYNAIKQVKENYFSCLKRVKIDNEKLKEFQDEAIVLGWEKLLQVMQQNYQLWRDSSSLAKKIYFKYRKN